MTVFLLAANTNKIELHHNAFPQVFHFKDIKFFIFNGKFAFYLDGEL